MEQLQGPIISFFKKKRHGFKIALGILGLYFLVKIGEAFLGRMSIIFYKEIGFSKSDINNLLKRKAGLQLLFLHFLGGLVCYSIRCYQGYVCFWNMGLILWHLSNLLFYLL